MDEMKKPSKPLIYYWAIAMMILTLFNLLAKPWYLRAQIAEVDYGTFITMTEEKKIAAVQVRDNQIVFTDGYAEMPEQRCDAIWVVYGNTTIHPPGGRVIYSKPNEEKEKHEIDFLIT